MPWNNLVGIDPTSNAVTNAGIVASAIANVTDGAAATVALDPKRRVRIANKNAVDPWSTYVKLYGSITTAAVTDTQITNTNSAGGNYPTNAILRTVTTGKTLYIKKIMMAIDGLVSDLSVFTLAIGGVKEMFFPIKTNGSANYPSTQNMTVDFDEGYPVAAGTVIAVYFRTTSGSAVTGWIRIDGKEETN